MNRIRAVHVAMVLVVFALAACSDDDPPVEPPDGEFTHPTGVLLPQISLSNRPFGAAAGADDLWLATRLDAASVSRGLTTGSGVPVTMTVGNIPTDVSLSADGLVAYVTNQTDGTVGFVNLASGTQTATTPIPGSTFRVLRGAGGLVYVSTNVAKVYSINATTHAVVDSVTVGADPNGMVFSPSGTKLYVTNRSSGDLSEVNPATMTVTRTITLGGTPQDVAISLDGTELYVANESGPMQVVTVATGGVVSAGAATGGLFGLALSPDGVLLVGSRPGSGDVLFIDRASRAVTGTIATSGTPRRVALSPSGAVAVVANEAGWVDRIR